MKLSAAFFPFVFLFTLRDGQYSHYVVKKNTTRLLLCLVSQTHLANSKEWVSCLILINLISQLIQTSALPVRPSPGDNGKPTGQQLTKRILYFVNYIYYTFAVSTFICGLQQATGKLEITFSLIFFKYLINFSALLHLSIQTLKNTYLGPKFSAISVFHL